MFQTKMFRFSEQCVSLCLGPFVAVPVRGMEGTTRLSVGQRLTFAKVVARTVTLPFQKA